ncbi:MAG: endonuclease/exonuclease/phosphatase family protein [Alphaproteobacteria bacterium GM7ARS4]|nr:endonuclease/exonuclease/phosphatase family protein [Alphaproteobacteria bacterium GM7ARS4]
MSQRSLRVVTWNINSVRSRVDMMMGWLRQMDADIVCLQETKARPCVFPTQLCAAHGYAYHHIDGIKRYNGVAMVSRLPLVDKAKHIWCGRDDARHISASVRWHGRDLLIHNLYVPAGGDVADVACNPKFAHKLAFIEEAGAFLAKTCQTYPHAVVVGDLNIAPLPCDVWSHEQLLRVVSHTPIETRSLCHMQERGRWVDAVRHVFPPPQKLYTWWSYRARHVMASDRGRRLDHIWVSRALCPHIRTARIFRHARTDVRPSDHVPVLLELAPS